MGLVLRLRKLGSNTYRTYQIDDTAYIVPAGSEQVQREAVLNQVSEAIEHAIAQQTFVKIPVRHPNTKVLRFMPRQYKMHTIDWED